MMKEVVVQALFQKQKKVIRKIGPAPAAILIPIYEKAGEYYLVLTKRTENVSNHKGQISFPGGSYEVGDRTLRNTAIRETCEEIGIDPMDVEIIGELDDIETTTNFVISPFVAFIPYPYEFRSNAREVEEIIEVPISALLDGENIREEQKCRDGKFVAEYSYEYRDWIIWGATAKILKQFLELVSSHNGM